LPVSDAPPSIGGADVRAEVSFLDQSVRESMVGSGPWVAIAGVIACMSVFVLTLGLTYPLLALILARAGHSEVTIGVSAAMTPLGLIVSAPLWPALAHRIGAWNAAIGSVAGTILFFVALGMFQSVEVWYPLRFGLGMFVGGVFIISETWINQLATERTRGRIVGIYTTVLSLGFALGPVTLTLTGIEGWPPFLVGALALAMAGIILVRLRRAMPVSGEEARASMLDFLPLAPALLVAVGVFGYFDQAALSLLPVYSLSHGMSQNLATIALAVLVGGNVFLQMPIGWLADHMPRRLLMCLCAAGAAACGAALPFVIGHPLLLWPLLFVWGGVAFGTYTAAMAELGQRFSGSLLLAGNAAFALMWGVGGIIGPPVSGGAMELWGPEGLPVTLALVYAGLAVFAVVRGGDNLLLRPPR
jgi:MFS family permease